MERRERTIWRGIIFVAVLIVVVWWGVGNRVMCHAEITNREQAIDVASDIVEIYSGNKVMAQKFNKNVNRRVEDTKYDYVRLATKEPDTCRNVSMIANRLCRLFMTVVIAPWFVNSEMWFVTVGDGGVSSQGGEFISITIPKHAGCMIGISVR